MGFFFATSSGVIVGSADAGFSCVKFGFGKKTPQSNRALATKIVRRIASSRQVEHRRRSELGLILSGFYARTRAKGSSKKGKPTGRLANRKYLSGLILGELYCESSRAKPTLQINCLQGHDLAV